MAVQKQVQSSSCPQALQASPAERLPLRLLIQKSIKNLILFCQAATPPSVILDYIKTFLFLKPGLVREYAPQRTAFLTESQKRDFSESWFCDNIPFWLSTLKEQAFDQKPEIKALEIGSWEGLSSLFMMLYHPRLKLVCVDTWEGGDEHKKWDSLNHAEQRFDGNLSEFKGRITKFKGTSYSYFNSTDSSHGFDLVYVDGSHYADDVIVDLIKGFERLAVGGIMIIDDFMWQYYKRPRDNPIGAINAFLKMKKGHYKILRTYRQIILKKASCDPQALQAGGQDARKAA